MVKKYQTNNSFRNVRSKHDMENTEDYLEIVSDLIKKNGEARIVDIANKLDIAQSTANKTIKRLINSGFLYKEPYRSVFLTVEGQKLASNSKKRHQIVYNFLRKLGVSKRTASLDSEGIEHHVSPETLEVFKKLTKKLEKEKLS